MQRLKQEYLDKKVSAEQIQSVFENLKEEKRTSEVTEQSIYFLLDSL